jgi:SAM-dependent methyltransferase
MWLLGRGEDLCYDRPTIGFNYSLWYHPKRINTFLKYFANLIYDSRNESKIEIFDLGAGTGAVLWAIGIIVSGMKTLGMPCPNIRVVNIDTSPFMLSYSSKFLWKNFLKEFPLAEGICNESDYRLNSWSNLEEVACTNIWLCASYLFDHSDDTKAISDDFRSIVEKYKPNKVILLSSLRKSKYINKVADSIKSLNYIINTAAASNQIFSGPLRQLYNFRDKISKSHNLGLTGMPKWDELEYVLHGVVLENSAPLLALEIESLSLYTEPQRNRKKICLTPQQEDAAIITTRPTIIIGPAGSGKSVVLTQKIFNIIQSSSTNEGYDPSLKILVTTFNKGLVAYLGDWLEQILDKEKFIRVYDSNFYGRKSDHSYFRFANSKDFNISILHFDLLPTKLGKLKALTISAGVNSIEEFHTFKMTEAIDKYVTDKKIDRDKFSPILNPQFLLDEYQRVIYGFECSAFSVYSVLERIGRGSIPQLRYNSERRKVIWDIISRYIKDLLNENQESFILRRHRFIKSLRKKEFSNKFTHIIVDEFQDCTRSDYEIFYQLLNNPNNLTLAGDIAQSINLGTALHIPKTDDQRNFFKKKLDGSFRLPFRVSECIKPLSKLINKKFGEREGLQADIINPYKGAPPGSRPIYVFANDTSEAATKIAEVFSIYQEELKLKKVSIYEKDPELNLALLNKKIPTETDTILRVKGLEKDCVIWSSRILIDASTEIEEFVYTILTRTVSLLVVLVFPGTLEGYEKLITMFLPERLIFWDSESDTHFKNLISKETVERLDEDTDTTTDLDLLLFNGKDETLIIDPD